MLSVFLKDIFSYAKNYFFSTSKPYTYLIAVVNRRYFRCTLCWSTLHEKNFAGPKNVTLTHRLFLHYTQKKQVDLPKYYTSAKIDQLSLYLMLDQFA